MNFTYAFERTAAQTVFASSGRKRRLLRLAIKEIARTPLHTPDFSERDQSGRELFTRFFGPYAVTYWIDHAVAEVRIAGVFRD